MQKLTKNELLKTQNPNYFATFLSLDPQHVQHSFISFIYQTFHPKRPRAISHRDIPKKKQIPTINQVIRILLHFFFSVSLVQFAESIIHFVTARIDVFLNSLQLSSNGKFRFGYETAFCLHIFNMCVCWKLLGADSVVIVMLI